jgi:hypothetical protein
MLRRTGRALLVIGAIWLAAAMFTDGFRRLPGAAWVREATRPHWVTYRDRAGAFQIDHLSHWQVIELLPRLTREPVGPLTATVRLVFRYHDPFAVVTLARYESPRSRDAEGWFRLAAEEKQLAAAFGEQKQVSRRVRLPDGDRRLVVAAEGPVRDHTFRFQSLFVPRGKFAWRVTAGADVRDWKRIEDELMLVLASFHAPARK